MKGKQNAVKAVTPKTRSSKASRQSGAAKVHDTVEQSPVVLDIAGTVLTAEDRRRLCHPLTGGVIFFARNWHSREQLTALCAQIKTVREDLLIAVDHEGGRVQRFRTDGFTHLPPMRDLGALWMQDPMVATQAATACGYILAAELRACGVDFSFTPVLDLDHGPSGVIGNRAFHRDARVVSLLAKSVMHGLLLAGMASCGKHFPGHGYVAADSHTAVPVDARALTTIMADDVLPYVHLGATLSSVMPAHVIYPRVDAQPAGFSARWLQDILRGQLGFTGAVFSDDLSMEGARVAGSPTQGALAALHAGCDMVLLCNQSVGDGAPLDALLAGMSEALACGEWLTNAHSEARRLALLPQTAPLTWDELMHEPRYHWALGEMARVPSASA